MQTLSARARTPEDAKYLETLGFNSFEITLPCPGGVEEEEAWIRLAEERQFTYLGHGPNEGDPNDLNNLEFNYLPKLLTALKTAQRLRCPKLTVHFWLESRWLSRDVILNKVKLLGTVINWAHHLDVAVNLENLSESWLDLNEALKTIPDLGLTLDVGHANILQEDNFALGIIENLFPRINHIHLHDNHGGNSPKDDLHLVPGQGSVPFSAIFSKLKNIGYSGTATLEVKPEQMVEARQWVDNMWKTV